MMRLMGEMCRQSFGMGFQQMTSPAAKAAEIGSNATPEVRALFEDWAQEVEREILSLIKKDNKLDLDAIAKKLGISEESAVFFLNRIEQKKTS